MPAPFDYPAEPHKRRHGPLGYADYASYRPWLRDEFLFRCVYCLLREQWGLIRGVFALDHFHPVAIHPEKVTDYDNLLYACVRCNLLKGSQVVPDPTQVLLAASVHVREDGGIEADSVEAERLIRILRLNDPEFREYRLLWMQILRLAALRDHDLHQRLLAYPADLPDLAALAPPEGNTRPGGVAESCHARRQREALPTTY